MTPTDQGDDLSALAWVHDELRRSLTAAHKTLRRFVKENEARDSSDINAVDPSVLRSARSQIHQGVGALELVGQTAAAMVLRASETLVLRFIAKPHKLTSAMIDDIERASFALLDYLARLLARKSVSPLSLFPQYRAVLEAAGADRVNPADLWAVDWQWRDLPVDVLAKPRQHDAATHAAIEAKLLPLMRSPNPLREAARMSDITAGLGAGASNAQVATLWKLASAVFEAQANGLLVFDLFSKRVASRLLAQFRIFERGESEVSERLAQDLLFFCVQSASPGDGRRSPRLAAVRQAYGLVHQVPVDYSVSVLGRFDPAVIAQARKRVGAAKESWSGVAGGEMHRLSGLSEQFALVGESLKRLFPYGEPFATELLRAITQTQRSANAPPVALAMEVATSLLYIEAALDDGDFDHPELAARVRRLAERLAAVREGGAASPLEGWMEELYRRVSDRQTMGSVVQELRASLSEAELLIDQYFRKPEDRHVLMPVPGQLSAMRGVLSVLGMEDALAALVRMRDEVEALASADAEMNPSVQAETFDRLAGNLGALGFLIDMLSVQPQLAKSLFTYDATTGRLNPVMGRSDASAGARSLAMTAPVEQRLIEQAQMLAFTSVRQDVPLADVARDLERLSNEAQAAGQPALAAAVHKAQAALRQADDAAGVDAARGALSEALVDFVSTASDPQDLALQAPVKVDREPKADVDSSPESAQLIQDEELREIFLEEAHEVLENATSARADLARAPDDLSQLTSLRRAFHTLKGSSRMVGLKDFGEAAWACEQLYNTHLAEQAGAPAALLEFTEWCLGYLAAWVEDITHGRSGVHDAATVIKAVRRLGEPSTPAQLRESAQPSHSPSLPSGLPSAADLDLHAVTPPAAVPQSEHARADDRDEVHDIVSKLGSLGVTTPTPQRPADSPPTEWPVLERTFDAPSSGAPEEPIDLEFDLPDAAAAPPFVKTASPAASLEAGNVATPPADVPSSQAAEAVGKGRNADDDHFKVVGPLRISIPLFNIYLNEADELSRRLSTEVAEWAMELHRPIAESSVALAHSLAGSSATVGFADLSHLARLLEHAQARSLTIGRGTEEEARLFVDAADEIRRLLNQFAAGFLEAPASELLRRLAEHELSSARRLEAAAAAAELPSSAEAAGDEPPRAAAPQPTEPAFERLSKRKQKSQSKAKPLTSAPQREVAPLVAAPSVEKPVALAELAVPPLETARPEMRFDPLGVTELKPFGERAVEAPRAAASSHLPVESEDAVDAVDAVDAIDLELFPIFEEEAEELLPQLASRLRDWADAPGDPAHPAACMRTLHTLKGGARLAGAMRLGELVHRLETRVERLMAQPAVDAADIETLQLHGDTLTQTFDALRAREPRAAVPARTQVVAPVASVASARAPELGRLLHAAPTKAAPVAAAVVVATGDQGVPAIDPGAPLPEIDWTSFAITDGAERRAPERGQSAQSSVRVRAPLLDRLVNQAGEVSITRSRIETGVMQIKSSLTDLTENLERLRSQLRDIEFQGEIQMTSRLEAAKAASQAFDPLEFDRFTRFQELTRMMAESVNDVATVHRTVQRSLEITEDELVAQARMTRDLQDDLLRTRMIEFEGLADRLYRVARLAAKETGKSVRLDIEGGRVEIDRGVLDRMTPAFEHLLRNCVSHGIELPDARVAAGKDSTGTVIVALTQEGNEVGVEFRDDGAGLNLPRIRSKAVAAGLLDANANPSDADLANLIFAPGFSTSDVVTELSGRGVGMDVVRSEVNAIGGRVETATTAGQGTSFKLILPLTTAVTQVVMLRCAQTNVAVPSTLVEVVRRATPQEIADAYSSGSYAIGGRSLQFFWLGALLQTSARPLESTARSRNIIVIRSAQQRIALHVDEVLGNQEVVVKNLGPQLARLPGLAGVTLLASGEAALIYNPVALATLYGDAARAATQAALRAPTAFEGTPVATSLAESNEAPLVMVVDDSLTVRRVTQRLLLREGYRVVLAKDGLDALERLAEDLPQIVLSDIEMPRMDGFDLVRNMRADSRLRDLPVIMITSRIAQKHRDYAAELGVEHYLGKPYSEEILLSLIARYTKSQAAV